MRIYGWKADSLDKRDHYVPAPRLLKLPRKADALKFEAPIGNQGPLGACTAWAVLGVVRSAEIEAHGSSVDPSELATYYWTRVYEGTVREDSGAQIRNAIKSVVKVGYCDGALWPYKIANFTKKPSAAAEADARKSRVTGYARVRQNLAALKESVVQANPVVFGFSVFESFDAVAKTGIATVPRSSEEIQGGHAVVIVGYDDDMKCFLIRNSWGTRWGKKGYFWMPYEYVLDEDLAADFWTISVVP